MQGRLFSYLDTQLNRFNGINFHEIPINRSVAPVVNNQQNGYMRQTINHGRVNYFPNSLGNGSPMPAPTDEGGYVEYLEPVSGPKVRRRGQRFRDYFSRATLFWNSVSPSEQFHLVDAARFELSRVESQVVRQRMVLLLDFIDRGLAVRVAQHIGDTARRRASGPCGCVGRRYSTHDIRWPDGGAFSGTEHADDSKGVDSEPENRRAGRAGAGRGAV
jgi:catalase